jgi:hypothetical protein
MATWVHEIEIPENMRPYADATIARVSYLWPDVAFEFLVDSIKATAAANQDLTKLNRDLRYGLYRAKIQSEHKELKDSLYRAVFG